MDKIARIKELINILNEASKAYYAEDVEIMSNFEYDKLYDELVALEEETGTLAWRQGGTSFMENGWPYCCSYLRGRKAG